MMDRMRRKLLEKSAVATVASVAPRMFARSTSQDRTTSSLEQDGVHLHYEERGEGFPLLVVPGGGLNSTVAGLETVSYTHLTLPTTPYV